MLGGHRRQGIGGGEEDEERGRRGMVSRGILALSRACLASVSRPLLTVPQALEGGGRVAMMMTS